VRELPTRKSLQNLLRRVVPALQEEQSGYTQIARLKYRRGDGALVVRLSLSKPLARKAAGK
jgi:ribosomal protein L17